MIWEGHHGKHWGKQQGWERQAVRETAREKAKQRAENELYKQTKEEGRGKNKKAGRHWLNLFQVIRFEESIGQISRADTKNENDNIN